MKTEYKTKQGCLVTLERHGEALGVTIKQPDGRSHLFTAHKDDIKEIAALLAEEAAK